MGWITQTLGENKFDNYKLADNGDMSGRQYSLSKGIKATEPLVNFVDLEFAYKTDAITFNAINKSVQMIMSGGFKGFLHTKKNITTKFTKFFENIGEIGTDTTSDELLEGIFRDEMVYGNAFVEKIYDATDTKIVDLAMIDPKKIDYAKTDGGKIILDRNGSALGYTIKLESGTYAEGDIVPETYERTIKLGENDIFVLAKRIAHFKLYTIGDKFYGIGLIEPAYKSGIYKKNIEKGQANSIYSRGFSPLIAYVGNERRMATPTDIKGVLDKIKTLDYQKYATFPDWVKLEPLKYEQSELTNSALKDLRIDQISALSAPEALVSGSGEATNRATLGDQRVMWEFTLKDIIKQTMSYFQKYILKPIEETNNIGGIPVMEWGELRAEDINQTTDQIIRILTSKSSNITEELRNDLEADLRELMNLKSYPGSKKKKPLLTDRERKLIEENKKKEEENNKKEEEKKDVESKLSNIIGKVKLLEIEKEQIKTNAQSEIANVKNMSELEKEKKNNELDNKIAKLTNEFESKINKIEKGKKEEEVTKELEKLDSQNASSNDEIDRLIKEKKIKQIEEKDKLIAKMKKDMADGE